MRTIVSKVTRNLVCASMLLLGFVLVRAVLGDAVATQAEASPTRVAASPLALLIAEHHCWTGEAPATMRGVVPGHVVVTGDGRLRYAGPRTVSQALDQIFKGADHGLTVHAFCR